MKIIIDTAVMTEKQAISKIEEAYYDGICKSFCEKKVTVRLSEYEKGYYDALGKPYPTTKTETYCMGTKEQDRCDCNGDRKKCTHYPQNRK